MEIFFFAQIGAPDFARQGSRTVLTRACLLPPPPLRLLFCFCTLLRNSISIVVFEGNKKQELITVALAPTIMFYATHMSLRPRTGPALRQLRRHLRHLRLSNRTASELLQERRRLASLLHRAHQSENGASDYGGWQRAGSSSSASPSSGSGAATAEAIRRLSAHATRFLPRNEGLEAAIAFALTENRDARTELELTRHLLNSTLLSLASPVGPWDPYDVKPQVFGLDTFIALPVFTSLDYVRAFCNRFGFAVRDPSGVLWTDGRQVYEDASTRAAEMYKLIPDSITDSEWWRRQSRTQTSPNTGDAETERVVGPNGVEPAESDEAGKSGTGSTPSRDEEVSIGDADDLFDWMNSPTDARSVQAAPTVSGKSTTTTVPPRATRATAAAAAAAKKKNKKRSPLQKTSKRRTKSWKSTGGRSCRTRGARRTATSAKTAKTEKEEEGEEGEASRRAREATASATSAAKEAFFQAVAAVSPFGIKQATPLPTFGPFIRPFFVGYFADINTLLHNAAIVPDKVDIVLNPCSPIEFVLSREATDRVLHRDQLLLLAYQRVERELQREFSSFFATYCPEVRTARSACVPRPLDYKTAKQAYERGRRFSSAENPFLDHRQHTRMLRESAYSNGVAYELVILLTSDSLNTTYARLQWAKAQCLLVGHAELDVLPEDAAAPHVRDAAQVFFDRASEERRVGASNGSERVLTGGAAHLEAGVNVAGLGVFRQLGSPQTVNVAQSADSFYHDPTNAYTEAHAVFTEEMKVKRGQR